MDNNFLQEFSTPTYLFDVKALTQRIAYIKSKLDPSYKLIYAVKANTFVAKEIENYVDGYEICSTGEYDICHDLKINLEKFLISGVNKDARDIERMLNDGIKHFTVESKNQYNMLESLTKKLNVNIDVLIRITSGNQFGVSEEDLNDIILQNQNNSYIKIIGIEYFTGTQKSSIKKVNREIDYLTELIDKVESAFNINFEVIEIGTGSPVFYFQDEVFDEEEYFNELNNALSKIQGKIIKLEMGRSIAACCGKYFTSVVDKKTNKNGNVVILDGGMNHLVYYGQTMAMRIPHFKIYPFREGKKEYNTLYGSLCTINDIIVKNIESQEIQIGDIFVFENVGAYSAFEGISLFLSRDLPKIVLKTLDDKYILLRDTFKTKDINFPNYN